MRTASIYLAQTETAVTKLFEGIESYVDLLKPIEGTAFVGTASSKEEFQKMYDAWAVANAAKLEAARRAQQEFSEQIFAMATLSGAVLQVAAKAIELYSKNKIVEEKLKGIVGSNKSAIPFCIGREVKNGIPIGLAIYAGRNQHMHFNEDSLSSANSAIFDALSSLPGHPEIKDPALELANPFLESHANNITYIIGWRTYEAYFKDMHSLLGV